MVKIPPRSADVEMDFPSSPSRPPNFVVYANNTATGCVWITGTVSTRAMVRILEILTKSSDVTFRVSGNADALAKYVDPDPANPYQLPENVDRAARAFAGGGFFAYRPPMDPETTMTAPTPSPVKNGYAKLATGEKPGKVKTVNSVGDDVADRLAGLGTVELLHLAKINNFYKDSYEALGAGRTKMTVSNVLRSKIKRGETVKWK
jgi:hypothetical protein